jgi:hypothetical protein
VKRLTLDLATTLLPHPQPLPDLLVALRAHLIKPIATRENLTVPFRQQPQRRRDLAALLMGNRPLWRIDGLLVGDEIAERRRVLTHRLVR